MGFPLGPWWARVDGLPLASRARREAPEDQDNGDNPLKKTLANGRSVANLARATASVPNYYTAIQCELELLAIAR
eukprot:7965708-Pyramimonas_sp.AAC.1